MREITCGDALEVLGAWDNAVIDAVITDPPYLVKYQGKYRAHTPIAGDADASWVAPVFREIYRVMKPDTFCVSFYGWPQADVFVRAWRECGFRLISHLIFVKNQMGLGYYTRTKHEQAYLLAKGHPPYPEHALPDVYPMTRVRKPLHQNEKPQDALGALVALVSKPGDLILDPFAGSGSTGLAAVSAGRRFLGIEIDPTYAHIASDRLGLTVSAPDPFAPRF